ncbi:hypothetical protein [Flavihumibacter fluvii]|uniref:hypothetical protein n=1 Tax=Flavihumibacter fluvii TaxID=2838157 RepID=UPI001BDF032F|nr:hypothetical protein [Flavihumibacter fluvii]ULQ52318.1 hypothetical protein KJS93_19715 [Flavihumibacter fluvii]
MNSKNISYCPRLFRYGLLIRSLALFFSLALCTSLVSLPFASNKCKTSILNTVEEEAGSSNPNNINEEHKSGKSMQCHFPDFADYLALHRLQKAPYVIPASVVILSSNHCQKVIQPPDFKA